MTTAWVLGTASLMVTTIGALLVFLYLSKSPKSPEDWVTPDGKRAYEKHRRMSILSAGLLAAWLLVQDLAVLLL
jgi:hypothetical protein